MIAWFPHLIRPLIASCIISANVAVNSENVRTETEPERTQLPVQSLGPLYKPLSKPNSHRWSSKVATNQTIEAKIDTYLKKASAEQGFSGVVLVWRKRNLLHKGYGWADRGKTQPLTEDSKFYLASISKQFAAAAILQLEEQGRLSVNDSIGKFFKNVPPDKAGITIHHLLTHTSGLPQGYAADGIADRDEAIAAILKQPLKGQPGEQFSYTNDGYNLVAAIVEILAGTYEAFLRETLLAPARMQNTGFWGDEVKQEKSIADTVIDIDPAVRMMNWGFRGATGMFGTTEDLYKWQEALFANKVLSKESTAKLLNPYAKTSRGEYAYGWFRSRMKNGLGETWTAGSEGFGHNGIIKRYEDGTVLVVLSNAGNISGKPARDLVVTGVEEILFGGGISEPFVRINPMPSAGFAYAYYLYVPNALKNGSRTKNIHPILVLPNNTGQINDDVLFHDEYVKKRSREYQDIGDRLGVAVLVPVFPRPKTDWKIYTHALDRDSLATDKKEYRRFDMQLLAMIDHARSSLEQQDVRLDKRVLIMGFSASGMFANRFTFLHPNRVKAAVIGSPGGWAIAPVAEFKQKPLRYPVGVADLKTVAGRKLDLAALRRVPMFIYLGDDDENDSVIFGDGYETEDKDLIFELFGKTPVERWSLSKKLYSEAGLRATFRLYPGTKHTVTAEMQKDILTFLRENGLNEAPAVIR